MNYRNDISHLAAALRLCYVVRDLIVERWQTSFSVSSTTIILEHFVQQIHIYSMSANLSFSNLNSVILSPNVKFVLRRCNLDLSVHINVQN
jgi:hypothetical protein